MSKLNSPEQCRRFAFPSDWLTKYDAQSGFRSSLFLGGSSYPSPSCLGADNCSVSVSSAGVTKGMETGRDGRVLAAALSDGGTGHSAAMCRPEVGKHFSPLNPT